ILDGRLLVSEGEAASGVTLRLYDILAGKNVWQKKLPPHAVLLRVEDNELAGIVEPSGKVTVTDLRTQQDVLHATLDVSKYPEHLEKVNDGLLLQDRGYFYVVLNKPSEQAAKQGPWPNVMNLRAEKVNGWVYSFARGSGEFKWFYHAADQMILLER